MLELDEQVVTAVRNSSLRSLSLVNDELKALEAEIEPPPGTFSHKEEADFWLELPRTFSFTSARFELPLDLGSMANTTPVQYLSRHVSVSSSRRQLYDKVFTRHRSQRDGLLTEELTMPALAEVMGGAISGQLADTIWASLGVERAPHIENKFTFSQFSGIAAFTERIFWWEFCKGDKAGPPSPKVSLRGLEIPPVCQTITRY